MNGNHPFTQNPWMAMPPMEMPQPLYPGSAGQPMFPAPQMRPFDNIPYQTPPQSDTQISSGRYPSVSIQEPVFEQLKGTIYCGAYVDHSDVSAFIRKHSLSARDRKILQGVMSLLNEEPNWVWRHASVEAYGENIDVTFCAGDKDNKFVVCLNEHNEVVKRNKAKGLRLRVTDGVKSIWNTITNGTKQVLGAIGGISRMTNMIMH